MHSRTHGIEERRDSAGRLRYRVRVRRNGVTQTATLPTLDRALAWRSQALEAAAGLADPPPRPQPPSLPARRDGSVLDAARRLCRGMADGTVRNREGLVYKPSVVRKYEEALRLLVVPRIGAVSIATLTRGDCQRLVDEIAAEHTPEHARKALTALRVSLRIAERYGELDGNPCAGVRVPVDGEGEKPARILTPEEAAAIVAQADADDARLDRSFAGPLYALALGSGLRLGELLALEWGPDGLDVDAGMVRVRWSVDRVRDATGEYPRTRPKSRASRRDVPLASDDVARLLRHRLATGRPADGALVFAGASGEQLSPVPAYRAFKRACLRAGIAEPLPRPHDCRHAFATHALAAGLSPHAVAELLGHSDAGLVLRRYGHALPDEISRAGDVLAAWRQRRAESAQEWPTAVAATRKHL